ncbi:MAG: dihydrolipoamide acetyltransferase family protein [Candidatus Binatia bacterium]
MAQIIGLPKLSPTMEEGVLVHWAKNEGDRIEPGDLIAEVETDKANMDFNSEDAGVLLKRLVAEGETVKLGAPVAILGAAGENVDALVADALRARDTASPAAAGTETSAAPNAPPSAAAPASPPASPATAPPAGGRVLASPRAKSLAIELGIDLRQIAGTAPGGRIVERDVRAAHTAGAPAATPTLLVSKAGESAAAPLEAIVSRSRFAVAVDAEEYVDRPLSNMRRTIAARLSAAAHDIPHFRITASVECAKLIEFRDRLNALLGERGRVTVNDLIVKGAALALRRVPEVNAAFLGDAIRYFTRVHIGVAVALEHGLVTPVVRNADLKGIGVIGAEIRDLVIRAKERRLKADEIAGSTFTVSNLGMFPVDHFDAIINPPEAAVLAVGRATEQPVVVDGKIRIGQRMALTMSCDHRVVDGVVGARYLQELIEILESPESLAL